MEWFSICVMTSNSTKVENKLWYKFSRMCQRLFDTALNISDHIVKDHEFELLFWLNNNGTNSRVCEKINTPRQVFEWNIDIILPWNQKADSVLHQTSRCKIPQSLEGARSLFWVIPTALKMSSRPHSKANRAFNTQLRVFETSRDIRRKRFIGSWNGAQDHFIRHSGDAFEMPRHIDYNILYDVERDFMMGKQAAGGKWTGQILKLLYTFVL